MVVLGKHAMIIANTDKTAQVTLFTPDYKSMEDVPIVDGALAHVCPYTGKYHILICRKILLLFINYIDINDVKFNMCMLLYSRPT